MNAATIIFASLYPPNYHNTTPPPTIITPPPRFFVFVPFSVIPLHFRLITPHPQIFFVFIPFSVTPPLHFCHITPPLPTLSPNKPSGFFVFVPFLMTPNYIDASLPRPPPPRFFCLHTLFGDLPTFWSHYSLFPTFSPHYPLPTPYIFLSSYVFR